MQTHVKYNDFGFHNINVKDCNNNKKANFFPPVIDISNLLPRKGKKVHK